MWIPALAAVVIAAHHRWRVVSHGQTSWKGGGFAMFSDATENDLLTSIAYTSGAVTATAEVTGLKDLRRVVALAVPTEKAIRDWARCVLQTDWFVHDGVAVPCPLRFAASKVRADRVSVTHRRVCFDAGARGYRSVLVREVTLAASSSGETTGDRLAS
jgi:hypothetical protein